MSKWSTAFLSVLLATGPSPSQTPAAPPGREPAFEAAVVNVAAPGATRRAPSIRGNRFEVKAQQLPNLIAFAYEVNENRVVGGPNWLDVDRFDIAARAPSGTPPALQRQMLQALLAVRFKMAVREENRQQEAWVLLQGKDALKIKRSEGADFTGCRAIPQAPGATAVINDVHCRNVPMATIAQRLYMMGGGYLAGSVTDATGLTGTWDARFAVTPSSARAAAGEGSSVFDAAERMGLRLERRDTSVAVLAIGSVARTPTPDVPGAAAALAPAATEFEVATVRPVAPGGNAGGGRTIQPNGRILLRNMTVRDLISFAWDVPADMVVGGPDFVAVERFEVVGDAPASLPRPVDVDEFRMMTRALLASRFGLAVHRDMRPADAWVLTAKRDIRMAAGKDERGACVSTPERIPPNTGLSAAITCTNTSMAGLVDRLPGMAPNYILNRPVFDETKLTGTYDFLVLWTGLAQINGRVNALQPGDKESALATVGTMTLEESLDRLGLRLALEKRPVRALVIDNVQRPSGN